MSVGSPPYSSGLQSWGWGQTHSYTYAQRRPQRYTHTVPGKSRRAIVSNWQRACRWSHWGWRRCSVRREGWALPFKVGPRILCGTQTTNLGSRRGCSPAWLPALGETAQAVRGEGILELIVAVACGCREVLIFLGPLHLFHPHPPGLPRPLAPTAEEY